MPPGSLESIISVLSQKQGAASPNIPLLIWVFGCQRAGMCQLGDGGAEVMAGTEPITPTPQCLVVFWRKGRLLCKLTRPGQRWGARSFSWHLLRFRVGIWAQPPHPLPAGCRGLRRGSCSRVCPVAPLPRLAQPGTALITARGRLRCKLQPDEF